MIQQKQNSSLNFMECTDKVKKIDEVTIAVYDVGLHVV